VPPLQTAYFFHLAVSFYLPQSSKEFGCMSAQSLQIDNLNELRNYVQNTICEQNELQVGAFSITERVLVRGRRPCGIFFCLHGPRSVKLTAIWETDRNTILFYSSSGERVGRTQLVQAPVLAPSLA
jgi:hypothetical protein